MFVLSAEVTSCFDESIIAPFVDDNYVGKCVAKIPGFVHCIESSSVDIDVRFNTGLNRSGLVRHLSLVFSVLIVRPKLLQHQTCQFYVALWAHRSSHNQEQTGSN